MCSNFYNKLSPMIGKEFIEIFKIRYLDYLGWILNFTNKIEF